MLAKLSQLSTEYIVANEGRMGFIMLRIAVGKDELARGTEAVNALRELIADTKLRHPEVKIGLTGLPIMENDEMRVERIVDVLGGRAVVHWRGDCGYRRIRRRAPCAARKPCAADRYRLGVWLRHTGDWPFEHSECHVHGDAGGRWRRLRHVLCFPVCAATPFGVQLPTMRCFRRRGWPARRSSRAP